MSTKPPVALTRNQLYQQVWARPLSAVAGELGVSGNALAKICNRLLIPYPPRGYWTKRVPGRTALRPKLPAAPEGANQRVTIDEMPAASRRRRTRLDTSLRREQLIDIAASIIHKYGLHAATMKRIAAQAGISETHAYNYFGSQEKLFIELARAEYARIEQARQSAAATVEGHYSKVEAVTRAYLRQIDRRGGLLQMLLRNPEVRSALKEDRQREQPSKLNTHIELLQKRYGVSEEVALGCTTILNRLCLRAAQLIADRRVALPEAERLCLSMVLNGSRKLMGVKDLPADKAA